MIVFALLLVMVAQNLQQAGDEPPPRLNEKVVGPIQFNADWIKTRWAEKERPTVGVVPATLPSEDVQFDNPDSILRFVLRATADQNDVLPSERYYYYQFVLGHRLVSGNLRFVDVEAGILHIGYFDFWDRSGMHAKSYRHGEGIEVVYDEGNRNANINFAGLQRTFTLSHDWDDGRDRVTTLPHEELVSGVLDESGFYLWLMFDTVDHRFYYVLNPDRPLPERIAVYDLPSAKMQLQVGVDSRFVFYNDSSTGRLILVGVHNDAIARNTYFDGPFDQVPPRLSIKDKLESAYPYVRFRGGIDEHGNLLQLEGQRVAISPYQGYKVITA